MAKDKPLTFQQFVKLCGDADELLRKLLKGPSKLQGKRPYNLKAAAVWYLARQRGLHVTMHRLHMVYGTTYETLMDTRRRIEEACDAHGTVPDL